MTGYTIPNMGRTYKDNIKIYKLTKNTRYGQSQKLLLYQVPCCTITENTIISEAKIQQVRYNHLLYLCTWQATDLTQFEAWQLEAYLKAFSLT